MNEEDQDVFLAEWVIEGFEAGKGRSEYGWALSAVQKVNPRRTYKTAWKVYDAWGLQRPPQQAAAAPPELITAMIVAALLLNKPQLSLVILLCYTGLLRVRECLHLTCGDVFLLPDCVTLCLGLTKRGMEQKVVLRHESVVTWIKLYLHRFSMGSSTQSLVSISYSTVLRWTKRLAALLGAGDIHLTTHSFRRSGASELSRQGMPMADLLLFGRWLRERSAREYVRRGEVAVLRARSMLNPTKHARMLQWSRTCSHAWALFDLLYKRAAPQPTISRLTQEGFDLFERRLFDMIRT